MRNPDIVRVEKSVFLMSSHAGVTIQSGKTASDNECYYLNQWWDSDM